ncbi:MAG TPA: hypothetical protein VEU51_10900, partial [Candidatus Acidoferrales bacterium]|nr:hypothetical protein [Candidatus Acidoferrales bacterium]
MKASIAGVSGLVVCLAIALAGCASTPARAESNPDSAAASTSAAEATPAAASMPQSDGQSAFLDGYRAWQNHD